MALDPSGGLGLKTSGLKTSTIKQINTTHGVLPSSKPNTVPSCTAPKPDLHVAHWVCICSTSMSKKSWYQSCFGLSFKIRKFAHTALPDPEDRYILYPAGDQRHALLMPLNSVSELEVAGSPDCVRVAVVVTMPPKTTTSLSVLLRVSAHHPQSEAQNMQNTNGSS